MRFQSLILLTLSFEFKYSNCQVDEYGADVSWPMHHHRVKKKEGEHLGDRQSVYDNFLKGCYRTETKRDCDQYEHDRIEMNRRQPRSMQNYTEMGFTKIRAPEKVFKLIKDFWENNKESKYREQFRLGDAVINRWDSPSYMVSVDNSSLIGGGYELRQEIWDSAEQLIQDWTGQKLRTSSLYGVRVYTEGAILTTHVDRLPLVSSAIINVAQDVDEPWPLEVIGHDGKSHNITMEVGDLVFYESHSVIHGRPFALKGKYYANIFIHFAPSEISSGIPSYIIKGSPEDIDRRRRNKYDIIMKRDNKGENGSNEAHKAARAGDLELLKTLPKETLFVADGNGWTPLHEASRAGHLDVIKYLLAQGDDLLRLTLSGRCATSLAEDYLSGDHEAKTYLKELRFAAVKAVKKGDLNGLEEVKEKDARLLTAPDNNGWQPIHEAARKGHFQVIKYLIENGANPLDWTFSLHSAVDLAKQFLSEDHLAVKFLTDYELQHGISLELMKVSDNKNYTASQCKYEQEPVLDEVQNLFS